MEQKTFEELVMNVFFIPALFKKKLINKDLYKKDIDLIPSHFHILFTLEGMGSLPITELARTLTISKPNMTPLVQKLIDMGYVERIPDNKDRRYIYIKLTDLGKEFLAKHKKLVIEDLRLKIGGLNENDLEKLSLSLQNLKDILEKI